jgi:hypothetical protein
LIPKRAIFFCISKTGYLRAWRQYTVVYISIVFDASVGFQAKLLRCNAMQCNVRTLISKFATKTCIVHNVHTPYLMWRNMLKY